MTPVTIRAGEKNERMQLKRNVLQLNRGDGTYAEIAQLTAWSRRPKTARAIAERARIILASASGAPSLTVAVAAELTPPAQNTASPPNSNPQVGCTKAGAAALE